MTMQNADSSSKHDLSEVAAKVFAHHEDIAEIKTDLRGIRTDIATLTASELRREGARKAMVGGWAALVALAGAVGWLAAHYKP